MKSKQIQKLKEGVDDWGHRVVKVEVSLDVRMR